MIPGHIYLSMIIPPEEKIGLVIALILIGIVISYGIAKAILFYTEQRYHRHGF